MFVHRDGEEGDILIQDRQQFLHQHGQRQYLTRLIQFPIRGTNYPVCG